MEGTYEIMLAGAPAGQATVRRQGLYWQFTCRCDLSGETVCRVRVTCGGREADLGILVPEGGQFRLVTRVAASKLGAGVPEFRVLPRRPEIKGKFIPLRPEEPFQYIHRLEDAFLARQNGELGIVIPDQSESKRNPVSAS